MHPVRLCVNGVEHDVVVDPLEPLLRTLRERVGLSGSKTGCGTGYCGACTVLVDGEAVNACLVLTVDADRKEVVTIEGLASARRHAASCAGGVRGQRRFAMWLLHAGNDRRGRVHCSPQNPDPSDDEIRAGTRRESLPMHRLSVDRRIGARCGPADARRRTLERTAWAARAHSVASMTAATIGTVHPRNDARAKVTGGAIYTADVVPDNALAGVVLRSPHSSARIVSIDIARAAAMPGVRAVVYSGNVPSKPLDFGIKDQHLFPDRLRPLSRRTGRCGRRRHGDAGACGGRCHRHRLRTGHAGDEHRASARARRGARASDVEHLRTQRRPDDARQRTAPTIASAAVTSTRRSPAPLRCSHRDSRSPRSPGIPRAPCGRRASRTGRYAHRLVRLASAVSGNRTEMAEFFELEPAKVRFINQLRRRCVRRKDPHGAGVVRGRARTPMRPTGAHGMVAP